MAVDPTPTLTDSGTLAAVAAGGATVGAAGLKLAEKLLGHWFVRAENREEREERQEREEREAMARIRAELREEMLLEMRVLRERCTSVEGRLDDEQRRRAALVAEMAELKGENHAIRARDHQMRGYMAVLVGTTQRYHRLLGLPEADLPRVPDWIHDPITGPTTRGTSEDAT